MIRERCLCIGAFVMLVALVSSLGVLASDLPILHLGFDQQTGTPVQDVAGRFMADLDGNPAWGDGYLLFDGLDDRVVLPQPMADSIGRLHMGTIVVRFRYDYVLDRQEIEPIFYYGIADETEPDNMFVIEIGHKNPRNRRLYATWVINRRIPLCFDTGVNLIPGRWYEFALVVDPSGNTGYLDGVELTHRHYNFGNADCHYFLADIPANELSSIGYGKTADGKSPHFLYFKGAIDDLQIYDRPLSAVEIGALHQER